MSEASDAPPEPPASIQAPERVTLSETEIEGGTSDWPQRWRRQEAYSASIERRFALQQGELAETQRALEKARTLVEEAQQRERLLVRRLTAKEQETHDLVCQLNELKTAQPASVHRSTLLDPAVNLIVQHLKAELQQTRSKLDETQNELSAWKFTPDSNTGKRLMAKCRLLYQENEELGKLTSSGRIAKLESDLALQRSFGEEVRQSQNELDTFLGDLDEDVEGMQSTILFLQTELRKSKEMVAVLAKENGLLKASNRSNGDSSGVMCADIPDDVSSSAATNEAPPITDTRTSASSTNNRVKRMRRSSVLSIDYVAEEDLGLGTNGDVATDTE